MEIRQKNDTYIITPLSPKLDERQTARLKNEIQQLPHQQRASLDLSFVHDCTIEFIESIKNLALTKEIGIFNISSDIFSLFNLMGLDKFARLYVSETDFEENTRQLINRKFAVL